MHRPLIVFNIWLGLGTKFTLGDHVVVLPLAYKLGPLELT